MPRRSGSVGALGERSPRATRPRGTVINPVPLPAGQGKPSEQPPDRKVSDGASRGSGHRPEQLWSLGALQQKLEEVSEPAALSMRSIPRCRCGSPLRPGDPHREGTSCSSVGGSPSPGASPSSRANRSAIDRNDDARHPPSSARRR
jgi:hypothetical protein